MSEILIKIIPLDLAATLSPGIFALALFLLGSKLAPRLRTLALFVGILIVGIGITALGFTLGKAVDAGPKESTLSSIIDIAIGIFFIVFAFRALFSKERRLKESSNNQHLRLLRWIIIGIIISATNFDALFLNFAAAKEVGGTNIIEAQKILLLCVNILFFVLPALLPLVLYCIFPEFSKHHLERLNVLILKYSKYIIFVLFIVFGIYLLYRGGIFFVRI